MTEAFWNGVTTTDTFEYIQSTDDLLHSVTTKALVADGAYKSGHCVTRTGTGIPHAHYQYDFGQGGMPSPNEVKALWDYRLACHLPGGPTGGTGATNVTNCYCYAAANTGGGGAYNYWIVDPALLFSATSEDYDVVNKENLTAGDALNYRDGGLPIHSSMVTAVDGTGSGKHADSVEFKYAGGGIYAFTYAEWVTGSELILNMCWTDGRTLTWNKSNHLDPTPYVLEAPDTYRHK